MKVKRIAAFLAYFLMCFLSTASACETQCAGPLKELKRLVGVWRGDGSTMGDGAVEFRYAFTSGGSALLETISPGTPHEMNSVYYEENSHIFMTHYCMLGNHPKLKLTRADAGGLNFDFAADNPRGLSGQPHMHSLRISFIDENTIVERWVSFEKGKEKQVTVFKLVRVS